MHCMHLHEAHISSENDSEPGLRINARKILNNPSTLKNKTSDREKLKCFVTGWNMWCLELPFCIYILKYVRKQLGFLFDKKVQMCVIIYLYTEIQWKVTWNASLPCKWLILLNKVTYFKVLALILSVRFRSALTMQLHTHPSIHWQKALLIKYMLGRTFKQTWFIRSGPIK